MTRDRDADVERICQQALERPVAERADFLVEACAGYRQQYDVSRDGPLLINVALESDPPPITLLFDWKPRLK